MRQDKYGSLAMAVRETRSQVEQEKNKEKVEGEEGSFALIPYPISSLFFLLATICAIPTI